MDSLVIALALCHLAAQPGDGRVDGEGPEIPATEVEAPREVEAGGGGDRLDVNVSLRFANEYFFRGLVQRSDAFNAQPSVEIGYRLLEREVVSLTAFGGLWGNLSDETANGATGSFHEKFYEADYYAGLTLGVGRVRFTAAYTWYTSPASDFEAYQDVTVTLSLDDKGLWPGRLQELALSPYVAVAIETTEPGADGGASGAYLELGIAPTLLEREGAAGAFALALPVSAGFSLDDYYENEEADDSGFGFLTVGLAASWSLPGERGLAPTIEAGVDYLVLGDGPEAINGGDGDEWVFSAGISWSF